MGSLSRVVAVVVLAAVVPVSPTKVQRIPQERCLQHSDNDTIYNYSAQEIWSRRDVPLSTYRGKQEPGANATEIINGIKYVRPGNNYQPNFQLFAKIEVNGNNEHPLFTYLKLNCPATRDGFESKDKLFYEPFKNWDIRWNWEKFLIDRSGRTVIRYDASTSPETIASDIENLITRN